MASSEGFGSWRHLATRFVGALSPAGPSSSDDAWAESWLVEGEKDLWRRMSGPDRRHAVGVARDAIVLLGPEPPAREVIAAALLHDVGKVVASIGTFARVGVTLAALAVGRDRLVHWSAAGRARGAPGGTSVRTRVGLYLTHDDLGAGLLEAAGSSPLTIRWAAEHHLAETQWSLEAHLASALKAADGD